MIEQQYNEILEETVPKEHIITALNPLGGKIIKQAVKPKQGSIRENSIVEKHQKEESSINKSKNKISSIYQKIKDLSIQINNTKLAKI
jgi:hypothetical protein